MNSKFVNGRGLFLSLIMEKGDLSGIECDCVMNNREFKQFIDSKIMNICGILFAIVCLYFQTSNARPTDEGN